MGWVWREVPNHSRQAVVNDSHPDNMIREDDLCRHDFFMLQEYRSDLSDNCHTSNIGRRTVDLWRDD